MRPSHLRAILAIAVLVLIALVLWRPSSPAETPVVLPDSNAQGSDPSRVTLAVPADPASAEPSRVSGSRTEVGPEPGAIAPGRFVFDITFVPVDSLGRAMAGMNIEFALTRRRPNRMGTSAASGELHVTWRGTEPMIDGVVSATHATRSTSLTSVHLVAGEPCTVRFCADRMRSPLFIQNIPIVGRNFGGDSEMQDGGGTFFAPEFVLDAAGNGVFTDPDLLVRQVPGATQSSSVMRRSTPFTTRKLGGGGRPTPTEAAPDRTPRNVIECFVHDAEGHAVSNVPLRLFQGNASNPDNLRTNEEGQAVFTPPSKDSVDVEVGGGVFALVRKTLDVSTGGTRSWDVQLPLQPILRGHLLDVEGKPLGAWRIQAREDVPPYGFLQSCVTDAAGNFGVGIANGQLARLLASPPDADDKPARLIRQHVSPAAGPIDFALSEPELRVNATWRFVMPEGYAGFTPQARVVRRDSGEGVTLDPCDSGAHEGRRTFAFCLEGVLPGPYALTNLAPGGSSTFVALLNAEQLDIGNIPLEGNMEIVFASESEVREPWSVRATARAQGVLVRSEVLALPGRFMARAGELQLDFSTTAEGRAGGIVRNVSGIVGQRIEIALDDLR